jgi:hypothetical protein
MLHQSHCSLFYLPHNTRWGVWPQNVGKNKHKNISMRFICYICVDCVDSYL